jgi:hypothetical protein
MSEEFTSMAQVRAELDSIRRNLEARDRLDQERRKVDDAREQSAAAAREHLLERVDGHGRRTTALETKWEAFFSEQGAFRVLIRLSEQNNCDIKALAEETRKSIQALWRPVLIGIGGLAVLNIVVSHIWK